MALTVQQIRAAFPALGRRIEGRTIAFFDGPGGTQVPEAVVAAMADYLRFHNANTHWNYPTSQETDRLLAEAREAVADFLNAAPDEVAFGPNMTTLTFHLSRGLARSWSAGDEIVTTELDHHGNVGPWQQIARDRSLGLKRVPFRLSDGTLDPERVLAAIGPRTRIVAVGWASNALGSLTDVATICRAARERGVLSFVDAVHSAPHVLPDVRALDCDFLACSPYKFYGPHQGVLYASRARLGAVDIPKLEPAPNEGPERLETGTQIHEGICGTRAAIDFLASIAPAAGRRSSLEQSYRVLRERSDRLFRRLWDGIGAVPGVRRYGPEPTRPRTPTIAFTIDGAASSRIATRLSELGVFLSHGDFYAATVVDRYELGSEGLIRAGCACYTDDEDVDRLLAGLAEAVR
jgi:cysteine desulfurase family protein (TIGR01976 family)